MEPAASGIWDDLCSLRIEDPDLDHVRVLCSNACFVYPPTEKGHYCSSQGREYLRELARKLREGQRPRRNLSGMPVCDS